jgi:hypothetical protein
MAAKLHLAENALALHLLLERLESLVDVVVADENLHAADPACESVAEWKWTTGAKTRLSDAVPYQNGSRLSRVSGRRCCARLVIPGAKPA